MAQIYEPTETIDRVPKSTEQSQIQLKKYLVASIKKKLVSFRVEVRLGLGSAMGFE